MMERINSLRPTRHLFRVRLWLVCVASAALLLGACGGGDEAQPCEDLNCDFGVCDGSSGQCVNPDNCEVDQDCVPGFECGAEYVCVAIDDCRSNGDCAAGVCSGGACVNPETCESNGDCLERTYCGFDDTCRPDPCNEVSCSRGVCERGTDNCVSADSCTVETEATDCVEGEKCADGTCKPQDTYCEAFECERGVCSFAEGGCVSADNCEGDDDRCLDGEFCDGEDQCSPDLCLDREEDCGDNGVCQPATGECENATTCESDADCVEDHLCIEGTCRLEELACGDATGDGGCPGNRICDHDTDTLVADCVEPDDCETSVDCDDGRQCGGLSCLDHVSCRDDVFEPNDSAASATQLATVTSDHAISASLCDGDTDVYGFDTYDLVEQISRGALLVDLEVPRRDRGLGRLELVVIAEDGTELVDTTDADGHARIRDDLSIIDHGEYTVEVRPADGLTDAGVRYDLRANFLPTETADVCADAETLSVGQTVVGDTDDSDSRALDSSCTDWDNPSRDVVFSLVIDSPQEVTLTADPLLSESILTMSLRESCAEASSEIACADEVASGQAPTLNAVLDTGTYDVIVEAAPGEQGGTFELSAEATSVNCASDQCVDARYSNACNAAGSGYSSVDCELGCNPTSGRCFPVRGNTCLDAELLDAEGAYNFDLRQVHDEYDGDQEGCVSGPSSRTDGPDQTYMLEVPAQTLLTATVHFQNGVDGSAYLVEDCESVGSTCLQAAVDSQSGTTERLQLANDTDDAKSMYLIVDTAADQNFGAGSVEIDFADIICTPGEEVCAGTDVEVCNNFGTGWDVADQCGDWACDSGVCQRPDTCSLALDLTTEAGQAGGVTYSDIVWGEFSNHIQGDTCGGVTSYYNDAHDAIFQVDLQTDEVLRAKLITNDSAPLSDPAMYFLSSCGDLDSCLEGDRTLGEPIELFHQATSPETVYVVADTDDPSTSETFDLEVEIVEGCSQTDTTPTCNGDVLEYCGSDGFMETYTCTGGCTNGACDAPGGDVCVDAIDATSNANQTGGITYNDLVWGDYANSIEGDTCGGVTSGENDAHDVIFEVDMQPDDVLRAKLISNDSAPDSDPALYILETCGDLSTCIDGDRSTGDPLELFYRATTTETVYVVADSDDTSTTETFDMELEVTQAECDPATDSSTCVDSSTLEECVEPGVWQTRSCSCSSGVCLDGETCGGAIPLGHGDSDVQTFSGTNSMSPGTGTVGSCNFTTDNEPLGPDHIYAIDLAANETLTVTYTTGINGSGSSYGVMYILETCTDANTCQVNGGRYPSSGSSTLTYTAAQTGTYYLYVERALSSSTTSYDYQVDIDIQ
ncbi:MAG: hypothetical protein ACLFVJ_19325 [Persicimonas sp.]